MRQWNGIRVGLLGVAAAALLAMPALAQAETVTVTTVEDGNDGTCDTHCTLREALLHSTSEATIVVPAGTYTAEDVTFSISGNRRIQGAGADLTRISAPGERVIMVATGAPTITGVRISDGTLTSGGGAGIHVASGASLTLRDSLVDHNTGTLGAGIYSEGTLTVERSLVQANDAEGSPFAHGGGVTVNGGTATLINTTLSDNTADGSGGGLHVTGSAAVTLQNVTLAENTATATPPGHAIYQQFGTIAATNTLVARTDAGACRLNGGITWTAGMVEGADTSCGAAGANLTVGVDTLTSFLDDNGGPTDTHAIPPASPATDAGAAPCPATDQRGVARPQLAGCDIGAYELAPVVVDTTADGNDGECEEDCTLREAMVTTPENTTVDLPAGTYDLTEGPLPAGDGRFLVGAGARTTTITASDRSRVMTVDGSASVSGVTLSDGNVAQGPGGAVHVGEGAELNLIESAVLSSSAETGGGIYSEGTLRIERSTIAFNQAEGETPRGGGLAVADGDAKLFDATISTNFSEETGAGLYTTANVELHNVTIAQNEARPPEGTEPSTGGGIQQLFDEANDRTVAFNTLVVENFGGNCLGTTGAAGMIDARFSMADDMLCNVPTDPESGNTPIAAFSADIDDLRDNGGETDTHALFEGSPAIGAAEPGSCDGMFDQRGLARPFGAGCDIGAYEWAGALTVSTTTDRAGLCSASDCSLREAVALVADEGEVDVLGGNYVLSRGALSVGDREVVVRGAGARQTTFTAGAGSRVLHVFDGGFVTLNGVRITGGDVTQEDAPLGPIGGGIAVIDAGVELIDSAVDGNVARQGGGIYVDGGGVRLTGTTVASNQAPDMEVGVGAGLYLFESSGELENSTISGNTAGVTAAGIATIGSLLELSSVTIADNDTRADQAIGSAIFHQVTEEDGIDRGETLARNTLLAENSGSDCFGTTPFEVTNVISDDESCPGQTVANALIGGLAANGGGTDTHALFASSPAIDVGTACPPGDQRAVSRPQGGGCDVGAYELISASPPSGAGGGGGGGSGGGGGGGAGTTQPPPRDGQEEQLAAPEAGEEVNALPKSGTVRVKVKGSGRFVELKEGQQIPVGSVVDATKGRVTIVAAGSQSADFYSGIFRLSQGKGAKPLTTLTLVEALRCPKAGKAIAAAKKKKRRLWGDGSGKFRTKGKHSAATVVGTKWLVEDRCTSTLTRVAKGRVSVRDFVKKKTVIVRAGKKYVARARR